MGKRPGAEGSWSLDNQRQTKTVIHCNPMKKKIK